jgi:hypothetical protein
MRRPPVVLAALALVLVLAAVPPVTGQAGDGSNPCTGTIEERPDGVTLVSVQGTRLTSDGYVKTDSRTMAVAPNGSAYWVRDNSEAGRFWTYDVDPLSNGNLLLATTEPGITVVEELNASTGEPVSVTKYENVTDAHDVDLINGDELIFPDKGAERNRVVIYNRTTGEVVWQYRFANHTDQFPKSGGGPYGKDWTHVNDVDKIAPGEFLVSVRNFDQVVVINRSTKELELKLGENGNYDVLHRQHNPQYLEGPDGEPTILVADSLNDRVVEYAREEGEWERTWELVGGGLDEPRDADRLPNGNTLVADRKGHRVLEVTPQGETVWEFYTPWQTYDVERYAVGDEPGGPTMREQDVTGTRRLTGSENRTDEAIEPCAEFLQGFSGGGFIADLGSVGGPDSPGNGGIPVVPVSIGALLLVIAVAVGLRLR